MAARGTSSKPSQGGRMRLTLALLATAGALFLALPGTGRVVAPGIAFVAHLFSEVPDLVPIRLPSQVPLVRAHLAIGLVLLALGLGLGRWLRPHARQWWWVFCLGYALRAAIWIVGGNLPLVPGDSCHYIEVASSIVHGDGPVKHYVESFFVDYPAIRQGRGVLDDWATPLYAYLLAGAYRLTGVEPGRSLEETFAVAKGVSFLMSLLALPALYGLARRRFGPEVGLTAMTLLAILPVHVLYAGFALRESLVALTSILAVWALTEIWAPDTRSRWGWALLAGTCGGLAILARNTALALLGTAGLYGLLIHGRRHLGPLLLWGLVLLAVIAPWGWATWQEYGEPFYTYTKYFQYTFSWTVHHFRRGVPSASDFYTWANAPQIARVKFKSLFIIVLYSTMILGLPTVLGFARRLIWPGEERGRETDRLVLVLVLGFVGATLAQIADVTQVAQLGRYYLPLFCLMLPTAVAGLREWLSQAVLPRAVSWLALTFAALLWADPSWAYDATWLTSPYQLHWPALRASGDWVRSHPEAVPEDSRIMTWFPWEFRLASGRTTILLPRSLEASAYEIKRIDETIHQYNVTHVLWGSFDRFFVDDPETLGSYLEGLRLSVGLTDRREIYQSPKTNRFPVRLYRLSEGSP